MKTFSTDIVKYNQTLVDQLDLKMLMKTYLIWAARTEDAKLASKSSRVAAAIFILELLGVAVVPLA